MIPLRDNVVARRTPFVNYALIAATGLVFAIQLLDTSSGADRLVEGYGMIPRRVLAPDERIVIDTQVEHPVFGPIPARREIGPAAVPPWLTLLTCIFLHGGWMHFLGNMWFLYIFGDNVEDRIGHGGYAAFYLGAGVLASATHLLTNASSPIPTIGASGAVAGVMGAYFLLYPRATVLAAIPIFFYIELIVVPAWLFLGLWFLLQFFQGTLSVTSGAAGGVAWWAHIGGFAAGMGLVWTLRQLDWIQPEPGRQIPTVRRRHSFSRRRPPDDRLFPF